MANLTLAAAKEVVNSTDLPAPQKLELNDKLTSRSEIPDTMVYRYVVIFLGLAIFIPLVPVIMRDAGTAQMLLPIATGALGALAGLLAPSPAP